MGSDHATATVLAHEYGFTARHWRRQAIEGKIPGAFKDGQQWRFDLEAFRAWWTSGQPELAAPEDLIEHIHPHQVWVTAHSHDQLPTGRREADARMVPNSKNARPRHGKLDWIYFFRMRNAVKIGVSNNVRRRHKDLQAMVPDSIYLMAIMPGSLDREQWLHDRFACALIRGEWFDLTDDLSALIERQRKRGHAKSLGLLNLTRKRPT